MTFSYLIKPMSFVLVIVLGYALKCAGFLRREDQPMLSRIMLNITLPCAIIQGFSGFERDAKLFIIVGNDVAVAQMVANNRQTRRYTGLRARLLGEVE